MVQRSRADRKITEAWAKMQLICNVLDQSYPEKYFPKGRVDIAHKMSIDVYKLLDEVVKQ